MGRLTRRQTCCEVSTPPTSSTFYCAAFARSEHKMHDPPCYCQHCLCFVYGLGSLLLYAAIARPMLYGYREHMNA